jgi:DNA invertase Pin-like site-specific DNA recombinase
VVQETASGAKTDRPMLAKLVASLKPGDLLVVTRLDRLARSTIDLLTLLKGVGDYKASFQSLGDQWADTTTAAGRLMLTILGGLAEFERELIKARTAEGRERAKGRGVRTGRKHKLTPHQQEEVRKRKAEGQSVRELGRSYNVSPNTISRVR